MNVNILEDEENRTVFKVKGIDHGFCNVIKEELWNDDDIEVATYTIEGTEDDTPRFVVETSEGSEAKQAVKDAIQRLKDKTEEFKSDIKSTT